MFQVSSLNLHTRRRFIDPNKRRLAHPNSHINSLNWSLQEPELSVNAAVFWHTFLIFRLAEAVGSALFICSVNRGRCFFITPQSYEPKWKFLSFKRRATFQAVNERNALVYLSERWETRASFYLSY